MPQLDILIWLALCVCTTISFWSIYYIITRWFILNYYFIFDLRTKIKNFIFTFNYSLVNLLFNNNVLLTKLIIFYQFFCNFIYYNVKSLISAYYSMIYIILYLIYYGLFKNKEGFFFHGYIYANEFNPIF